MSLEKEAGWKAEITAKTKLWEKELDEKKKAKLYKDILGLKNKSSALKSRMGTKLENMN